jgi:hypothetical protein
MTIRIEPGLSEPEDCMSNIRTGLGWLTDRTLIYLEALLSTDDRRGQIEILREVQEELIRREATDNEPIEDEPTF